jgi:hypothetical protein
MENKLEEVHRFVEFGESVSAAFMSAFDRPTLPRATCAPSWESPAAAPAISLPEGLAEQINLLAEAL